jgi:hypothetical protein
MGYKLKRAYISKYQGLLRLELFGLSHPRWVFVKSSDQIPSHPWAEAPVGWTVRTCPEESYEFGLPAKHMLQFDNIGAVVDGFAAKMEIETQFVIYPSWEFDVSGCCLLENNKLTVEAVKGDIAPLLRGKSDPEVVFEAKGPRYRRLECVSGRCELLSLQDQQFLIFSCRKIEGASTLILEWTKTQAGEILFHDWLEFK